MPIPWSSMDVGIFGHLDRDLTAPPSGENLMALYD
jgi:hypothetical protein